MYIESKDEMRKRGVKSPDFADGLVYAVAPVYDGPAVGDVASASAEEITAQEQLEALADLQERMISPF
jgi:hypothetical protein